MSRSRRLKRDGESTAEPCDNLLQTQNENFLNRAKASTWNLSYLSIVGFRSVFLLLTVNGVLFE
jgi:hypothetical protein